MVLDFAARYHVCLCGGRRGGVRRDGQDQPTSKMGHSAHLMSAVEGLGLRSRGGYCVGLLGAFDHIVDLDGQIANGAGDLSVPWKRATDAVAGSEGGHAGEQWDFPDR